MSKRIICLILVLVMCMTVISGCGSTTSTKEEYYASTIELSWWGNDVRHIYTMDGVDRFMELHPEINVDYRYGEWSGFERKNNVWMEASDESDVMQINYAWLSTYSPDGKGYYDLSKLSDYIDFSQFDESDLEYGKKNGVLNAIPIAFNTSTVCYNEDIFKEHNIDYPKTWDDLFDAAKKLSKDDIYVIGMSKKHLLLFFVAYFEQTTGKKVFDENGKMLISKDDLAYMLDFYKRLIDEKVLMPINEFDRMKFAQGDCAGSLFWISDADNYCKALEENGYHAVMHSYIMADDAIYTGQYMKPATMYAISDICENPSQAAMLLDYLLNDEEMILLQGTEKGVPVSKKAVEVLKENGKLEGYGYDAYNVMIQDKSKMDVMIPQMENEALIDAFMQNADAYLLDVLTEEETIDQMYKDMMKANKN